jgi:predicted component of viral defense system (DUF524 family)
VFFYWKRFLPVTKIEREHFHFYETFDSFSNEFKQHQFQNTTILIKGSRGMALERSFRINLIKKLLKKLRSFLVCEDGPLNLFPAAS